MNILQRFTGRTLQISRTRTIVTIVGIILSVATITAVTTFISSLRTFLIDFVTETEGAWHGAVLDTTEEQREIIFDSDAVKASGVCQEVGYAKLTHLEDKAKPYLYLAGVDDGFQDVVSIRITRGRMPQTSHEILIPEHLLFSDAETNYPIGGELKLEVGKRRLPDSNENLTQQNGYLASDDGEGEVFVPEKEQRYTIVGYYKRPSFEPYLAPGYTVLTKLEGEISGSADCYLQMKNPKQIYAFSQDNFKNDQVEYHYELLRFIGASNDETFNVVLYHLAFILIIIIMSASILLIYNAFSISVSERTRQFGLLSSVGATKRQIKQSVLYEGIVLSTIGIPLGILVGIAGIGITLKLTAGLFARFIPEGSDAALHLSVSWIAIAVAAVVGVITVLLSAYWPAKRAVRQSTIDSIRQTKDIKLSTRQVKTWRITYRLFGFEGMLARKNFKRSKKRYRTTVISLFVSIVLFISVSSFCAYM
ncbi:MAG: ABC transporter permease, partial [Oscillospiraceae bacterium]|nr:ABC transporter permease [Oscillospiraceae bacterium]